MADGLEFQLSTEKARQEVAALEQAMAALGNKLGSFNGGERVADNLNKISAAKVNPQIAQDISSITAAANNLANVQVDGAVEKFRQLGGTNLSQLTAQLRAVRTAGEGVSAMAPAAQQGAAALNTLKASSESTAASVTKLNAAIAKEAAAFRLAAAKEGAASLGILSSAAAAASTAVAGFSTAMGIASAALGPFGIALSALSFITFIKSSIDAGEAAERMAVRIENATGKLGDGTKAIENAQKIGKDLAISTGQVEEAFAKLGPVLAARGVDINGITSTVRMLMTNFKLTRASAEEMSGSLDAYANMVRRGAVNTELMNSPLAKMNGALIESFKQMSHFGDDQSFIAALGRNEGSINTLNAALMKYIEQNASKLPQATQSAASQVTQLGNVFRLFQLDVNKGVQKVIDFGQASATTTNSTGGLAGALNAAAPPMQQMGTAATDAANGVATLTQQQQAQVQVGTAAVTTTQSAADASTRYATEVQNATVATTRAKEETTAATAVQQGNTGAVQGTAEALVGYGRAQDAANQKMPVAETFIQGLINIWNSLFGTIKKVEAAAQSADLTPKGGGGGGGSAMPNLDLPQGAFGNGGGGAHSGADAAWGRTDMPLNSYNSAGSNQLDAMLFSGGGISTDRSGPFATLPAHAFVNAPHFAGGGLSDGGIPAVLHPNEAVIPLTGGGSVPVQLSGSDGIDRVWQQVHVQTELQKTWDDRNYKALGDLRTALDGGVSQIVGALATIRTSSSSGSSSSAASSVAEVIAPVVAQAVKTSIFSTGSGASSSSSSSAGSADKYHRWNAALEEWNGPQIGGITGFYGSAPALAGGSPNASVDNDGGFHAILHPDEAVIPLPDGRSVPVSFPNAGGGSAPQSDIGNRIWEQIHVQTELSKTWHDKDITQFQLIDRHITELNTVVANLKLSGGSGSSSGGSTATTTTVAPVQADVRRSIFAGPAASSSSSSSSSSPNNDKYHHWNAALEEWNGPQIGGITGFYGSAPSLAGGSPNASVDNKGGFVSILHPDEAVIPLPDGRSVPVNFQDSSLDRLVETAIARANVGSPRSPGEAMTMGGGGQTFHVTINIATPDVESFRSSKDQMLRELQSSLAQATLTLGNVRRKDDPTLPRG